MRSFSWFRRLLLLALPLLVAHVAAFWRMSCAGTLVTERLDPIVQPGIPSGHVHIVFGGNAFAPTMSAAITQKSTCTSCGIAQDLSNYWTPTVYFQAQNGTFISLIPVGGGGAAIYYEQRVTSPGHTLQGFPAGFRMTTGNPSNRRYNASNPSESTGAVNWACINYAGGAPAAAGNFPNAHCPEGLRAQVYFPSCWDGVNLDSPNHQDHMSYPMGGGYDNGVCPPSHPVPMISIFYEVLWDTSPFENMWYGNNQPFVLAHGDPTGYGLHGDFLMGWDPAVLQAATTDCNDPYGIVANCPHFTVVPDDVANGCILPAIVDERTQGVLPALPGCNPVTLTPSVNPNCPVPYLLSVSDLEKKLYSDMTGYGWQYVGCGADGAGNRGLTGTSMSGPTVTIESCLTFCRNAGYSMFGVEYSDECYCGNSLGSGSKPIPYLPGKCTYPCAGNANEFCGGYGQMSIYQKCNGACVNAPFGPKS